MKKTFEKPVINISTFSVEDIITASGVTTSAVKAKNALTSNGVENKNIFELIFD